MRCLPVIFLMALQVVSHCSVGWVVVEVASSKLDLTNVFMWWLYIHPSPWRWNNFVFHSTPVSFLSLASFLCLSSSSCFADVAESMSSLFSACVTLCHNRRDSNSSCFDWGQTRFRQTWSASVLITFGSSWWLVKFSSIWPFHSPFTLQITFPDDVFFTSPVTRWSFPP